MAPSLLPPAPSLPLLPPAPSDSGLSSLEQITALPYFPLRSLQSLSLINCDGVTGASLSGSRLLTLVLSGCGSVSFLNLDLPSLQSLDLSDCVRVNTVQYRVGRSMRGLRSCVLTGCRLLGEHFVVGLVAWCKSLRQLHLFGSGCAQAPNKGKRTAQYGKRIKTKEKRGLVVKLESMNRQLEVVTTKRENRRMKGKGGGKGEGGSEEEEEEEEEGGRE